MALIYIHTKFPKTKKAYAKAGDDNTDRLKQVMEKLLIDESKPTSAQVYKPVQGGSTPWSYSDRKKQRAKTFKL